MNPTDTSTTRCKDCDPSFTCWNAAVGCRKRPAPATPTEAHRELAEIILVSHESKTVEDVAQLIADSEMRAVEAQSKASCELLQTYMTERDQLRAWKESAMAVNSEWDEQAVAKLLGVPLGMSCRKGIGERVPLLIQERDQLHAEVAKLTASFTPNGMLARENESMRAEILALQGAGRKAIDTMGKDQECIRELLAEVERLKAEAEKEDRMATTTINQRDRAEDAADNLASAILGEDIDWPDHDAKWAEALEQAECVTDLRARAEKAESEMRKIDETAKAMIQLAEERAEKAEADVAQLKIERAQIWAALNFRPEASLELVLADARLLRPEMAKARERVQELEGRGDWDELYLDGEPELLKRVWQRMRKTETRAEKAEAEVNRLTRDAKIAETHLLDTQRRAERAETDLAKVQNLAVVPDLTVEERFNVVVNQAFDGWHHVGNRKPTGRGGWEFNTFGSIATFDFNQLTKLVVACHVVRVRAEIGRSGPRMLKIYLNAREHKPDAWSMHHPDGADLITMVQKLTAKLGENK